MGMWYVVTVAARVMRVERGGGHMPVSMKLGLGGRSRWSI